MNHHLTFTDLNTTWMPRDLPRRPAADLAPTKPKQVKRAVKPRPAPTGPKPRFIVIETPPKPRPRRRLRFALVSPLTSMVAMLGVGAAMVATVISYVGVF